MSSIKDIEGKNICNNEMVDTAEYIVKLVKRKLACTGEEIQFRCIDSSDSRIVISQCNSIKINGRTLDMQFEILKNCIKNDGDYKPINGVCIWNLLEWNTETMGTSRGFRDGDIFEADVITVHSLEKHKIRSIVDLWVKIFTM